MGQTRDHPPAVLVVAAISRHPHALEWTCNRVAATWGPVPLISPSFAFTETQYYQKTMGGPLLKQFAAVDVNFDPARLAEAKLVTNQWETEYAACFPDPFPRPLNIDPGYLTEAKLVLATTKDRDHRIYLHSGIFAEVTLHFHAGKWESSPWTYPDYRRPDYHQFFDQVRRWLRGKPGSSPGSKGARSIQGPQQ